MRLLDQVRGVEFSNPRRLATFHDWPSPTGLVQRDFGVLSDDAGRERALTWTTGKPRLMTAWHDWARIVDGSDGRTYVIGYSGDRRTVATDNQGRPARIKGRAVIYRGNLKPECAIYDAPGFHFNQIQSMRNLTNG